MRITTLSRTAGAILAAGILLIVGSGWFALQELRVNGPIYQRIAAGKDLIANVVPPPAYVVEAFLEATTIAVRTAMLARIVRSLSAAAASKLELLSFASLTTSSIAVRCAR